MSLIKIDVLNKVAQDSFEAIGTKLVAESKEINRLYEAWQKEDEKLEDGTAARAALAKYKDYEYSLQRKGYLIKFGGVSEGIVVLKPKNSAKDSVGDKDFEIHNDGADKEMKVAIENIGKAIDTAVAVAEKWIRKNRTGSAGVAMHLGGVKSKYDSSKNELLRLAALLKG